ncbi:MAG: ABC transporter permease [bacterium]|nr:ABC transporter permease [bacterium]
MKIIWKLFLTTIKIFYRDRMTFFFTLIFPFIFVIIFGFVFGSGSSGENNKLLIGILSSDEELYKIVNSIEGLEVRRFDSIADIRQHILKNKLDAGILYENNKVKLILNFTTMQRNPFSRAIGDTIANHLAKSKTKIDKIISLNLNPIDPGEVVTTGLGYMVPGVVAISIFNGALFSMLSIFSYYKKRGVLKRFNVTPIRGYQFIIGMILGRFIVTFFSATVVLVFSQLIFRVQFNISWSLYLVTASTSILGMMAFGILISNIFAEPEVASNVGSLLMTVMIFFSGVYFPLDFLPKYLRIFGSFLPLGYVAKSIRIATGIENGSISSVLNISLIMTLIFFVLVFIFGNKIFKAE